MRLKITTALVAVAFILPACGGPKRKVAYPAKGQVTDSTGKPAVGAMLVFHPTNPDPQDPARPTATVDETGSFTLTTYVQGDGAPEGEYAVTIVWPPPKRTPFEPVGPDQLKGQFADPAKTTVRVKIENKPMNEVPTIKLPVP